MGTREGSVPRRRHAKAKPRTRRRPRLPRRDERSAARGQCAVSRRRRRRRLRTRRPGRRRAGRSACSIVSCIRVVEREADLVLGAQLFALELFDGPVALGDGHGGSSPARLPCRKVRRAFGSVRRRCGESARGARSARRSAAAAWPSEPGRRPRGVGGHERGAAAWLAIQKRRTTASIAPSVSSLREHLAQLLASPLPSHLSPRVELSYICRQRTTRRRAHQRKRRRFPSQRSVARRPLPSRRARGIRCLPMTVRGRARPTRAQRGRTSSPSSTRRAASARRRPR